MSMLNPSLERAAEPTAERRPFRLKRRPEERVTVLGALMDLMKPEEVLWFVEQKIKLGQRAIVANHNAHSLYLLQRDAAVQRFFARADLVEVDSTPVLLWAKLVGANSRRFHRSTYLDWRADFWRLAVAKGWRVFYLGGAPGVAERAAAKIAAEFAGLVIDTRDGYFDAAPTSAENTAVVEALNAFRPDVIFVGMGMPRQEIWIEQNYERLTSGVVFSVGAAFDYEVGEQVAAPRWMGRVGLEWMFRLARNPQRLGRRYLVEPWSLMKPAATDLMRAGRRSFGAPRSQKAGEWSRQRSFPGLPPAA